VYNNDETGALSMALDPEWETGSKYVYVFYGSKAANGLDAGMRVSRFTHKEIDGGVSSRG
jgi:hypothetical protein